MAKSRIKKNMEVIGADGVHIGTVDRITAGRIRLTKNGSGEGRHKGHHHYIDLGLVADIEGQTVRLSAVAATAVAFRGGEIGGANLVNNAHQSFREIDAALIALSISARSALRMLSCVIWPTSL